MCERTHCLCVSRNENKFLISLGQLFDANVIVVLTKEKLCTFENDAPNATVVEGSFSKSDGMWQLDTNETSAPH